MSSAFRQIHVQKSQHLIKDFIFPANKSWKELNIGITKKNMEIQVCRGIWKGIVLKIAMAASQCCCCQNKR